MSISIELHTNSIKILYLYRKLVSFSSISFNFSCRSINILIRIIIDGIIHCCYISIYNLYIFIIWRVSILVITNFNSRFKCYHIDLISLFIHTIIKLFTRCALCSILKHRENSHLIIHRKILEYTRTKFCRTITKVSHLKREQLKLANFPCLFRIIHPRTISFKDLISLLIRISGLIWLCSPVTKVHTDLSVQSRSNTNLRIRYSNLFVWRHLLFRSNINSFFHALWSPIKNRFVIIIFKIHLSNLSFSCKLFA